MSTLIAVIDLKSRLDIRIIADAVDAAGAVQGREALPRGVES